MSLVTLWKNYLVWTQGIVVAPLIAGANRRWKEVAWKLVLVAVNVALLVQSYDLIMNHLAYQKTTNIRLFYEQEAPFPAVTFCNLNPFKKSMVEHSQELKNLLVTYTYVNKMKQAQMASRTSTTPQTTTYDWTESRVRRKRRDSTCTETVETYITPSPSQNFTVWRCANGTDVEGFGECNINGSNSASDTRWENYMASASNRCVDEHRSQYSLTDFQFFRLCADDSRTKCGVTAMTKFERTKYKVFLSCFHGADHNRVAKPVHNVGNDDNSVNQQARNHDSSIDIDN